MKLHDGFTLVHEHMSIDLSPGDIEVMFRDNPKRLFAYHLRRETR